MSGVCFNCTGNSGGEQCEVCEEGFDRVLPITFLPCDVCASGFFEAGNGSCIRKLFVCDSVHVSTCLKSFVFLYVSVVCVVGGERGQLPLLDILCPP